MWENIALTCCLSGICSLIFIKLSYLAYKPDKETPFWLKTIGVFWLFSSGTGLAVSLFGLIWS